MFANVKHTCVGGFDLRDLRSLAYVKPFKPLIKKSAVYVYRVVCCVRTSTLYHPDLGEKSESLLGKSSELGRI